MVDANSEFIWLVNAVFSPVCTIFNALVYELLTLAEYRPVASELVTAHELGWVLSE